MKTFRSLCLAIIAVSALVNPAKALDYTFEFTNTNPSGVEGTFYGTVYGLTEGSSAATEIVITGIPFTLGESMGITPDYALFGNGWSALANDFTVTSGVVTDVSLDLTDAEASNSFTLLSGDPYFFGNSDAFMTTEEGLASLHFTQTEVVPEPSTYAFGFLSVLALVYAWCRNSIRA